MNSKDLRVLPVGHLFADYRVEGVLGHGGFGITYLATDLMLHRRVAIKEYFPREFAHRDGTLTVRPSGGDEERDTFAWGLERFLHEARLLARFDHPNIVAVTRFFEANGTAYLVMDYCEGEPLDVIIERDGPLDFDQLENMLWPMLDALEKVHEAGLLHRDIKPANIFVRADGSPVLLDFGAARQEILGHSRSVTSLVTPAYSSFEQYSTHGRQGPWSDIYSLGATLYRAMTGIKLQDAPDRILDDHVEAISVIAKTKFPPQILAAVDASLVVRPEGRPQSVAEWRTLFKGRDSRIQGRVDNSADFTRVTPSASSPLSGDTRRKGIYIFGGLAAVVLVVWVMGRSGSPISDGGSADAPKPVQIPPVAKSDPVNTAPGVEAPRKSDPQPPASDNRVQEPNVRADRSRGCVGTDFRSFHDCVGDVTFQNGDRYSGEFVNGRPEGKGAIYYASGGTYVGDLKGGLPHGQGKATTKDGQVYTGGFLAGQQSGKGKYVWPSGDVFEGSYLAGKRHGFGVYRWANGEILEATYKDGEPQNPQKMRFASGAVYYGELNAEGVREGTGTYTFANGSRYVGEYKAGKRNGRGVEYNSSGEVTRSGMWRDGELISADQRTVPPRNSSNWFNSPTQSVNRGQSSDSEIMQLCRSTASTLKSTFPKKLDNVTTAIDASCIYTARGVMMVYKNTVSTDLGSDQQSKSKVHKAVFEMHRKMWCSKGDMREAIRQVEVEYHYYNPAVSELLLVVTLNDGECRKIGL